MITGFGEVILKGENGSQSDQRPVGHCRSKRECGTKVEWWQWTEDWEIKKHFKAILNRN